MPPGVALRIEAGRQIVIQSHYIRLFGGNGGTDSAPVTGLAWRDRVGVPPDDSRAGRRLERHAALGSGAGRPSARKRFVPSTVRTGLAIMNRSLRRRYS